VRDENGNTVTALFGVSKEVFPGLSSELAAHLGVVPQATFDHLQQTRNLLDQVLGQAPAPVDGGIST
jgi:hypothetical protein